MTPRTAGRLGYVEGPPAGPPLLLLHGVARNGRDWEPLLPDLVRDWRVIALDHRGHGRSDRADRYLVADYAADAAAFLRETFSEPVTILGHSLGAMVGLSLAAECAPLVRALILEDPPFHTMGRRIGQTAYRAQFAGMQQAARRGGTRDEITDALAEITLPSPTGHVRLGDLRDRPSLEFSAECLAQVDPAVFDPLIAGAWLKTFDHPALWSRVRCPTLLLQGDPAAGGAFTDSDVAEAQRGLAKCRHVRFAGGGHQIHRTRPVEVLRLLREVAAFLAATTGPEARKSPPAAGGRCPSAGP